jgi:xanthine dehydrogenase YagS FAD-binding subunit
MQPLMITTPADVDSAIAAHASDSSVAFIAGGTDLIGLMKDRAVMPARLLDINRLPGMAAIEALPGGGLRIGALARMSDVAADLRVRQGFPVIAEALLLSASGQLRNMASIAGNILQRTRCAYFYDHAGSRCNKREPGQGCDAIEGLSRTHAILGASPSCVAVHPSDMCVALAALDAVVHVEGLDGPRAIPLTEFHRLPGDEPARDTVLEHGALVTSVDLPPLPLPMATHSRYRKVRERASYAFAIASVAVAIDVSDGTIGDVRIALGAVAPKPWRARVAEAALQGLTPSPEVFRAAVDAELAEARPLRDNRYKIPLVRNVVTEMLAELSGVES